MNAAVIFTSKFGATQRTAEHISKVIGADLIDLRKSPRSISGYDLIVFGSGIYFGKMPKLIRKFIEDHRQDLEGKKVALFVCCRYNGEEAEKQLAAAAELFGPLVSKAYMSGKQKGELGIDAAAVDDFIRSLE